MGKQQNKFCFILFYFFRAIGIRNFDPRFIHSRPVCYTVYLVLRKSVHGARGGRARVSVNFRKFSPCIARTWRARGAPARVWQFTLPLGRWNSYVLAFDEYRRPGPSVTRLFFLNFYWDFQVKIRRGPASRGRSLTSLSPCDLVVRAFRCISNVITHRQLARSPAKY